MHTSSWRSERLSDAAPELERVLLGNQEIAETYPASAIRQKTVRVAMRDGISLATDLYFPPSTPAPVIAIRTPYDRALPDLVKVLIAAAQRGYVVLCQDCRGTGDSEPDHWDYYVFEREDSFDFVDWIASQNWSDGFLGSFGGSYLAGTQWCMAMNRAMSTIIPLVGGLGVVPTTRPRFYMFLNAYTRSVGKGELKPSIRATRDRVRDMEREMLEETLAGGYFNEPFESPLPDSLLERIPDLASVPLSQARNKLNEHYASLSAPGRAELVKLVLGEARVTISGVERLPTILGQRVNHDSHLLPRSSESDLACELKAPALMVTGWYDWCLDDTLATWRLIQRAAEESVRLRSRLVIAPSAHSSVGYREGLDQDPQLQRIYRTRDSLSLFLHWYELVRAQQTDSWPPVMYFLMGANEWRVASAWPPPEAEIDTWYLSADGLLTRAPQTGPTRSRRYIYDPQDPTPTVGGSIVSDVLTPGSCDVSEVQMRSDVLTYTSEVLEEDVDVVGPLSLVIYASSSAKDTDFSARLTDVFPDGRAIQLQHTTLRARYRNPYMDPEPLEPGRIYKLEIDMWATGNRFQAGHRIRLDVSSADFPKFDRNTNKGGSDGPPIPAKQTIYHGEIHPSQLALSTISVENGGNR